MRSKRLLAFLSIFASSLVNDTSVRGDCNDLPGNEFAAYLKRVFGRSLESPAAGHLHSHDGNALDIVVADNCRQLLGVVHSVQLWASDQGDLTPHKVLMHIGVGIGRAVCSDQQLCAFKERGFRRQ